MPTAHSYCTYFLLLKESSSLKAQITKPMARRLMLILDHRADTTSLSSVVLPRRRMRLFTLCAVPAVGRPSWKRGAGRRQNFRTCVQNEHLGALHKGNHGAALIACYLNGMGFIHSGTELLCLPTHG